MNLFFSFRVLFFGTRNLTLELKSFMRFLATPLWGFARNDNHYVFYLLINSESSRERIVAVATASISIERSPCDSNSCIALIVVPPGVVT